MKITGALFLATLFCVTWEKVHWGFGVDVSISDLLTILFLLAFVLEWMARGERRFPRTTATVDAGRLFHPPPSTAKPGAPPASPSCAPSAPSRAPRGSALLL